MELNENLKYKRVKSPTEQKNKNLLKDEREIGSDNNRYHDNISN
jgi:hypothetical protein